MLRASRSILVERKLNAFMRRQATRLVEMAGTCKDRDLRNRLLEKGTHGAYGVNGFDIR
jgi:hypothetical protein